jgi:hypothetical protein
MRYSKIQDYALNFLTKYVDQASNKIKKTIIIELLEIHVCIDLK